MFVLLQLGPATGMHCEAVRWNTPNGWRVRAVCRARVLCVRSVAWEKKLENGDGSEHGGKGCQDK